MMTNQNINIICTLEYHYELKRLHISNRRNSIHQKWSTIKMTDTIFCITYKMQFMEGKHIVILCLQPKMTFVRFKISNVVKRCRLPFSMNANNLNGSIFIQTTFHIRQLKQFLKWHFVYLSFEKIWIVCDFNVWYRYEV